VRPVQRLKADSLIFALSAVSGSLVASGRGKIRVGGQLGPARRT